MTQTEYSDANSYFRERFGSKVYKASISLKVTCPNRDGSKGSGGCLFCSEGGSGEFSASSLLPVKEQIDEAILRVSRKIKGEARYIAYFQSFTNTYCDPDYLDASISEAMNDDRICAVSIATRPDCISKPILDVLVRQNKVKPIMVELGLQTIFDETAKWFNRCYETCVFDEAVGLLKSSGIEVIAHIIFGLKDETTEMMLRTVKHVADLHVDGVKFTCLYVLKGTGLEKEWKEGKIDILTRDGYFDIVEEALKLLPPDVIVHRLTGDGPKSLLMEPSWTKDKRSVVNYINGRFKVRRRS